MADPWAEKPKAELDVERGCGFYDEMDMDAFHEKLRAFYHDWIADQKAELDEKISKLEAIKTWGEKYFSTFRQFAPIAELEVLLEAS